LISLCACCGIAAAARSAGAISRASAVQAALDAPVPEAPVIAQDAFLAQVRSHMPVLHVDKTDGFPLKSLGAVFDYRSATTQPRHTCVRDDTVGDDTRCPYGGLAHLSDLTPQALIDHIDYPAPFNTAKQQALSDKYPGTPTMYFYAKSDGSNRKSYTYWFFYSYNYFVATLNLGIFEVQRQIDLHEGDFEHVVVITDSQDKPLMYQFYAHAFHVNYAANDPRLQVNGGADHIGGYAGHVRAYAGHGSHASEIGCGLYDARQLGQRDRTCSVDPKTDTISTPAAATVGFTPANTALSDLAPDRSGWACFRGRFGAGAHGLTAGSSPHAPLVQSGDCAPTAAGNLTATSDGTYSRTSSAVDGVDRCGDWQTPPQSPGFQLVVCNQQALTESLAGEQPTVPAAHAQINGPSTPTAADVPAYVGEPDAAALRADSIVVTGPTSGAATNTPPQDIYVAQSRRDAAPVESRFTNVTVPADGLHVVVSGGVWELADSQGQVVATQTPHLVPAPPVRG
jgi:hypothetical protein